MRLAYFTDTYPPQVNGLVTSITTSRAELARLGHEVLVFAPHLKGEAPEEGVIRLAGLTYFPQPEYTWVFPWGRHFNPFDFKRFNVDLIHSHASFGAGLVAVAMAALNKLPLVMTYHTLWEEYVHYTPLPARLTKWINRVYSRWMCDRCALVIAPSEAIRQKLLSYGTRARIEVLPTGLSPDVFAKTGTKKADFGASEGQTLLSTAGRIGPEKRFHLLLEALAQLGPKIGSWRLAIAGDGPGRADLEALAAKLGLKERVSFLGYQPRSRVLDLMEASDLFVFPSPTETQGMVVIEAMGRGTPAVGVDAMGVGLTMKGDKGGWLAKPDDVGDLAAKIELALSDPAARAAKAQEALALAKGYSAGAINERLAALYEEVLKGSA